MVKKRISIILPTHNEAGNIVPLVQQIFSLLGKDTQIIVVDDISSDGTRDAVEELLSVYKNLSLIKRETKGLTSAIKRGIEEASGDLIGWMDCDFSHPPQLLPEMVKVIESGFVDCVVASRYLPGSKDRTHENSCFIFFHKILSNFLNRICEVLLVKGFKDYTSGFILIKKESLDKITFTGDYGEYFMELIYKADRSGVRLKEVPYISNPRRSGKSKTAENLFELFLRGRKYFFKIFKLVFYSN